MKSLPAVLSIAALAGASLICGCRLGARLFGRCPARFESAVCEALALAGVRLGRAASQGVWARRRGVTLVGRRWCGLMLRGLVELRYRHAGSRRDQRSAKRDERCAPASPERVDHLGRVVALRRPRCWEARRSRVRLRRQRALVVPIARYGFPTRAATTAGPRGREFNALKLNSPEVAGIVAAARENWAGQFTMGGLG